jgi:hypothetical protein
MTMMSQPIRLIWVDWLNAEKGDELFLLSVSRSRMQAMVDRLAKSRNPSIIFSKE